MDETLLLLFNKNLSNPLLDVLFVFLTTRGYLIFFPFIVWLFFRFDDKRQYLKSILLLIVAISLNDWLSTECKNIFQRIRPCHLANIKDVIGCSDSFSMPSNHASNSFAIATLLIYYFRNLRLSPLISIFTIIIALLISISRVYLGVHYPSDVIVGAILGVGISAITILSYKKLTTYYKKSPIETTLFVLVLVFSLFRIYYIRHGGIDLSPDEAHYWEWSRRLDWSYYSKGPLVAWLISASTYVFGNNVLAIRIMAVIMLSASSLIMYNLTRQLAQKVRLSDEDSKKAGLLAFLCMQIIPIFSVYAIVFTIDSPLILFWVWSLYFFYKATNEVDNYKNWLLLGLLVGLGLLAKYTMVFFIGCAFIYILMTRKNLFLKPQPYLSLIVTLLVFSPVIYWNINNDWVTIKHTAGQANISSGFSLSILHFFEFVGSQIGVVTPILFVMLFIALFHIRGLSDRRDWLFIVSFSLPVLLFFTLKSLQGKVQANWAMPAYISLLIGFSIMMLKRNSNLTEKIPLSRQRRLLILGLTIALMINLIGLYPHYFKIPAKIDPSARLRGWSMLAHEVDRLRDNLAKGREPLFIFSDSYQVASEMAFYLKGNPVTYCINFTNRRMNQYDLWEDPNEAINKLLISHGKINGLFVGSTVLDYSGELAQYCESYDKHFINVVHKGRLINSHFVFICYNLTSLPHHRARHF